MSLADDLVARAVQHAEKVSALRMLPLVEALRPLARAIDDESVRGEGNDVDVFVRVTAGDVRRAAAIVQECDERNGGSR